MKSVLIAGHFWSIDSRVQKRLLESLGKMEKALVVAGMKVEIIIGGRFDKVLLGQSNYVSSNCSIRVDNQFTNANFDYETYIKGFAEYEYFDALIVINDTLFSDKLFGGMLLDEFLRGLIETLKLDLKNWIFGYSEFSVGTHYVSSFLACVDSYHLDEVYERATLYSKLETKVTLSDSLEAINDISSYYYNGLTKNRDVKIWHRAKFSCPGMIDVKAQLMTLEKIFFGGITSESNVISVLDITNMLRRLKLRVILWLGRCYVRTKYYFCP